MNDDLLRDLLGVTAPRARRDNRDLPPPRPAGTLITMRRLLEEDRRWLPPHLQRRVRRAHLAAFLLMLPDAAAEVARDIRTRVRTDFDGAFAHAARSLWTLATLAVGGVLVIGYGRGGDRASAAATKLHRVSRAVRSMP